MTEEKYMQLFRAIGEECKTLFRSKLSDYGPTWLLFRPESFIDQLWIKAKRIRTLEENGDNSLVGESREGEFIGLINYAITMRMVTEHRDIFPESGEVIDDPAKYNIDTETVMKIFGEIFDSITALMLRKNHDYGAAWLTMDPHSITDQIIIKIFRLKNIVANGGKLLVSENIDAQLSDVAVYSMFGLMRFRGVNADVE